jgi:xylulokinase
MRSVIPGLWHPLAYIAGGGQALTWFQNNFGQNLEAESEADGDFYAALEKLGQAAPLGADNLYFSPHLSGRICPATPEMRGAWVGFSFSHTKAHFYRAVLESVAFEYAYYLGILKELIPNLNLTESRVIGGGARSGFWNQIKADVLGTPYVRLARSEFGTWGAAMIAGKAAGVYGDLAEVAFEHAVAAGTPTEPDPARHEKYQQHVAHYIQLQQSLAAIFQSGGWDSSEREL